MSLQSDQINELMGALAKAQGEMEHASKDTSNAFFKSKYADLAAVWTACRQPLAKNGLAVTQTLDFAGEHQVLVTTLAHSSGQWIKSIMSLPVQKPGPQELGSCLSYCRRYSLASMVGVYQDDDDGEEATKQYRTQSNAPAQTLPDKSISASQLQALKSMSEGYSKTLDFIFKKFNITKLEELLEKDFSYATNIFNTAKQRREKEGEKND